MKEDSSHQNCHTTPPILRGGIPASPHALEAPAHLLHWDGGPPERQQMLAKMHKLKEHPTSIATLVQLVVAEQVVRSGFGLCQQSDEHVRLI